MGRLFLRKGQGEMGEPIANVIHASTDLQIGIFVKVPAKPRTVMTLSYWPLSLSSKRHLTVFATSTLQQRFDMLSRTQRLGLPTC